jgi:hypothetical protein
MPVTDQAPALIPAHDQLPLDRLVALVDSSVGADGIDDGALLRVTGHPPQVGRLGLGGDHPLELLLGFTAPASWRALGIHCRARAYDLGSPNDLATPRPIPPRGDDPLPVIVTILVDRAGAGSGLLRRGSLATRLPGVPDGVVGDACRRALGLPTPAAPPSTAELWLRLWLDRVVEAAVFADGGHRSISWRDVAALHPAVPARPGAAGIQPDVSSGDVHLDDPEALAETTHVLARAWPWSRLRREPDVVDTARPPLPRPVAAWMDDGMFARWVLADLADLTTLSTSAAALLPPTVVAAIGQTVVAAGLPGWPCPN